MTATFTMMDWVDIRCPSCRRLLLRVMGLAIIETVCPRCSTKVRWPVLAASAVASLQVFAATEELSGVEA